MRVLPTIVLPRGSLAIADLHLDLFDELDPERGGGRFVAWLEALPPTPLLVILGDLFDVWVGPAQARAPRASAVLDALRARVQSGTRIALVPGNRDFLLERSFSARTGVELFTEGFVGASDDGCGRVLFVHGDTLCTRDRAYQRLRSVLRAPPVTALAPRLPLAWSLAVARRLRRASVRAVAAKLPEEKSIQRDAVRAAAETAHAALVVCGHAHEYRDERLPSGTRWVVLDAFGGARGVLRFEAEGHLHFTRD